jgi:hypothetical protein
MLTCRIISTNTPRTHARTPRTQRLLLAQLKRMKAKERSGRAGGVAQSSQPSAAMDDVGGAGGAEGAVGNVADSFQVLEGEGTSSSSAHDSNNEATTAPPARTDAPQQPTTAPPPAPQQPSTQLKIGDHVEVSRSILGVGATIPLNSKRRFLSAGARHIHLKSKRVFLPPHPQFEIDLGRLPFGSSCNTIQWCLFVLSFLAWRRCASRISLCTMAEWRGLVSSTATRAFVFNSINGYRL